MRNIDSSDIQEPYILRTSGVENPSIALLQPGVADPKVSERYPNLSSPVTYAQFYGKVVSWARSHYHAEPGADFTLSFTDGVKGQGPFLIAKFLSSGRVELLDCEGMI